MKFKRLKIVEQIIIISLIGVLIPSVISYFIINNISQHSLRRELNYSAEFIAKNIENWASPSLLFTSILILWFRYVASY